jgi:hypothetical protein
MPKQYEIKRGTWENKDLVGGGKKRSRDNKINYHEVVVVRLLPSLVNYHPHH